MKIVFVGAADSIHTVRWLRQFNGLGWDIHLFPTQGDGLHPEVQGVTFYPLLPRELRNEKSISEKATIPWYWSLGRERLRQYSLSSKLRIDSSSRLARLVKKLRPNLIHSMGIQTGGYVTLAARKKLDEFPSWIVSNMGCDIHYFERIRGHASRIKEVISACGHYMCECERDVAIARRYGLTGSIGPVVPQAGGIDLLRISELRMVEKPEARSLILIKGYQNWYGRTLVALKALELVGDELGDHRIALYAISGQDVEWAANLTSFKLNRPIEIIPRCTHKKMLEYHCQAKISISLSMSDGVCMSFAEALACGSFPIQSDTSCASEWARHGRTALFVDPEDPHDVAEAIRSVLRRQVSVNDAAEENWHAVKTRFDQELIKSKVIDWYRSIAS